MVRSGFLLNGLSGKLRVVVEKECSLWDVRVGENANDDQIRQGPVFSLQYYILWFNICNVRRDLELILRCVLQFFNCCEFLG